MRRTSFKPYLFLFCLIISLLSLPQTATHRLRSFTVASLSPPWSLLSSIKMFLLKALPTSSGHYASLETESLIQENELLREQIDTLREWIVSDDRLDQLSHKLAQVKKQEEADPLLKTFFQRRNQELITQLDLHLHSLPAKVIFRDPSAWNSHVWINVGTKQNQLLKREVVAKNSPVVIGTSLVGVVEVVEEKRSLVRLITDAELVPSVRAVRGREQNLFLWERLDELASSLQVREDLFASEAKKDELLHSLGQLKEALNRPSPDQYLAKGELHGTSHPLWRGRSAILKGVGFNYDFADEEGPARDLRSGTPIGASFNTESLPLLRVGDLLITTGLDGIFPAGLSVATITRILPLREGGCTYELEAKATINNFDTLSHVTVLAPLCN